MNDYENGRPSDSGENALFIHVDAMEQAKFRAIFKGDQKANALLKKLRGPQFRITMVAVRGHGVKRNYVFICDPRFAKGPNVVIEVLVRTFKFLESDGLLVGIGQIDLLLDNTCGENKCSAVPRLALKRYQGG